MLDQITPHIRTELAEGVLTVAIERPEKKNALTQDMYRAIAAALRHAQDDTEIGAVLLTGAETESGGVFTAGNDLMDFMAAGPSHGPRAARELLQAAAHLDAPLLAHVDGVAIGIGVTILLHCDYAFATPNARFKTPFIDLAACPEGASSLLMPRMIGKRATNDFLMLGKEISGEDAAACGLVAECSEDAATLARETAAALAAKPREAMRATKRLLRENRDGPVGEVIDREIAVFGERLQSKEAQAVIAAFFNRK